jgi:hypothetical protein
MASDPITTLSSYVTWLEKHPVPAGKVAIFRGLADTAFDLRPSVFRNDVRTQREHLLLRELIAAHPADFAGDASALEQLVRMQHFSLPTRLLDVTWNPLAALWFATEPFAKEVPTGKLTKRGKPAVKTVRTPGEVVRLLLDEDEVRYFDSDRVSLVTNLSRCRFDQKEEIRALVGKHPSTPAAKKKFNEESTVRRLLHFVRSEKPAFEPEIEPEHLSGIHLVKPKLNNRRILAQEGAFLAFGLIEELPKGGMAGITVDSMRIEPGRKAGIRTQLSGLSINQRTLYPDIERAAQYLTDELQTAGLVARGATTSSAASPLGRTS